MLVDPVMLRMPPSPWSGSTPKNIPRMFFSAQDDTGGDLVLLYHLVLFLSTTKKKKKRNDPKIIAYFLSPRWVRT